MSERLRRSLRRYGVALEAEAEAAMPEPDFQDVLERMGTDREASVIPFPGGTRSEPRPVPPSRSWGSNLRWAFVGAAACALLILGISLIVRLNAEGMTLSPETAPSMLNKTADGEETSGVGIRRAPAARSAEHRSPPNVAPPRTPEPVEAEPAPTPKAVSPPRTERAGKHREPVRGAPPPEPQEPALDPWAQRNAQAVAAREAGRTAEARRIFDEVARQGPARYAQLAYGELSLIVGEVEGVAAQRELWRRYLERFPAGRYADDWSAALCRTAGSSQAQACWQRHLQEYPRSAHAQQARTAAGVP
ncbi:MAG: hypothetical protein AAF799_34305 [Myxococcota bacterium]